MQQPLSKAEPLAFRLDDVGACSKRYEVYSHHTWRLGPIVVSGNWLFLKYLPHLKRWGPYRELTYPEWHRIFDLLEQYDARLTVAVTAAWPLSATEVVPFPKRFPQEAMALREGVEQGLLEIANHGLTHCVLEGNAFKPRWFSSNRRYHREFWDWVPLEVQEDHLRRSQEILQGYFRAPVMTFVPPGNVFTDATLEIASRYNLWYVCCNTSQQILQDQVVLGEDQVFPFHDRDIVMHGTQWLQRRLEEHSRDSFCFVRDLGEALLSGAGTSRLS